MRDNVQARLLYEVNNVPFLDYTKNEMKTWFTDLHARTTLGLQLVPFIFENTATTPPRQKSIWIRP